MNRKDLPQISIGPDASLEDFEFAICKFRKRVSATDVFKILKRRKLYPSVAARRRAKAKLSDVKRRRRHARKTIRKKT